MPRAKRLPRERITDRRLWLRIEELHWESARKNNPTADMLALRKEVRRVMEKTYGPCPPEPPKPPLKMRLGLWWLKKKLKNVPTLEVSMLKKKLIVSLVFGIGAVGQLLNSALADGSISGAEWGAMLTPFVAAFWGKFSSNTTIVAPSRKGENVHGPV